MSDTVIHLEDAFLERKIANVNARLQRIKAEHEAQRARLPAVTYPAHVDAADDVAWRLPSDCEVPFTDGAA